MADRTPDDVQEAWLTDACSVIGQHCGSDGSDDEHNDWINDLANALWDTLVQHPVTRAEVDLTNLREVVAGVRAEFEQAVTDPELDTGMANWLDALHAHLGAAVRGVTAEPDSAADRTPNELADRLDNIARNGYDPDAHDVQRAAAVLLRRQGEQLDTLRKAIGDPDNLRLLADTFDLPILARIAAAVPQDPERCACGKPATGTVGGVPTCGDDR